MVWRLIVADCREAGNIEARWWLTGGLDPYGGMIPLQDMFDELA